MDANAFRHFFEYHFAENRKIWERYVSQLSDEQFTRDADYSRGSVRDQIVHLIEVDNAWFSDLRGIDFAEWTELPDDAGRAEMRAYWDDLEQHMRDYLAELRDDQLDDKPLSGEDKDLLRWQILLHVVNHGTDHRAQILRLLNDLGVETVYQDYIFYVYGNP